MNSIIENLNTKFENLIHSNFKTFEEVASLKNIMGVYIIYNEKEEIIYIGKTNNFNVRFGTDLKHETTHTLVKKIIKSGGLKDRFEVKDFLMNQCKIKIEICDTNREAEALEHISIYILEPFYNK